MENGNRSREKILVVDDMPANTKLMVELLSQEYEVFYATNGEDGLNIAATELPDLIILDIMMPNMDGFEVCEKLKSDSLTQGIPVIFITALSDFDQKSHIPGNHCMVSQCFQKILCSQWSHWDMVTGAWVPHWLLLIFDSKMAPHFCIFGPFE